jgi:ketosteroid isomerase-like protein
MVYHSAGFMALLTKNICMKYLCCLMIIPAIFSCNNKKASVQTASDQKELIEVDRAFSKMSEEKGMKNAFIEYIDSNGVLLRPGEMPIIGANAIDYLIQLNDTGYKLAWQPNGSTISASGDLGYTFGIYAMKLNSNDSTLYGTYTTIWKRQKDGKWKFVLDSGNEGIGSGE